MKELKILYNQALKNGSVRKVTYIPSLDPKNKQVKL